MKIDDSWWKKKAKIKATNDKIFIGRIDDITVKKTMTRPEKIL